VPTKNEKEQMRQLMDDVFVELEKAGLTKDITDEDIVRKGLGDVVESVLTRWGITEEQFKKWTGLAECGCSDRKKWLNRLLSWPSKK
jgi:hypothetical protein